MPELKAREIQAKFLQIKDIVELPGTEVETEPLATIDKKTKYVWIKDEAGTEGRIALDTVVTVKRLEPTDAEIKEANRKCTVRYLEMRLSQAKKTYEEARQKMVERMAATDYLLDHWIIDRLLEAEADWKIWAGIENTLEIIAEKKNDDDFKFRGWTIREVVERQAKKYLYDAITNGKRATTRSSSPTSNLIDDIEAAAQFRFMDELKWHTDITLVVHPDIAE